jgi:hypothetical protein
MLRTRISATRRSDHGAEDEQPRNLSPRQILGFKMARP